MDKRPGSSLVAGSGKKQGNSESEARKVGIIFDLYDCEKEIYEYHIYLVDTDVHGDGVGAGGGIIDDYKRQIYPAARVQVSGDNVLCDLSALCFLNSTQGFNPPPSTTCYSDNNPYKNRPKSGYKYCVNLNLDLDLGAATSIPDLHHAKGIPVALPLPDGKKIIVFSTKFRFEESIYAFELFDPDSESWLLLPALPCPCASPDYKLWSGDCACADGMDALYTVMSYSFIDESRFFLQMPFGAFALNLNDLTWTTLYIPEKVDLNGYFEMVMGRCALAPIRHKAPVPQNCIDFIYEAYIRVFDFGNGELLSPKDARQHGASFLKTGAQLSFLAPPYPEEWYRGVFAISILRPREEENGQVCNTYVVQVESEKLLSGTVARDLGSTARILIDVCCTHLATLETTITKRVSVGTYFSEGGPYRATFFTI